MILNHKRETVWHFTGGDSRCPECSAELLARKGEKLVWHWAHKPRRSTRNGCSWEESDWHLRWKEVFHDQAGFEIEHPIDINGKRFVLDAVKPQTKQINEFIHSLSPSYVAKHRALLQAKCNVTWLWDGHVFMSERGRSVRGGGIKRLLKPKAKDLHQEIGGLVHIQHGPRAGVWRHWRHDVWYRIDRSQTFLDAYARQGVATTRVSA